jgi:drug/metabolite transporter (DMT)-like permease
MPPATALIVLPAVAAFLFPLAAMSLKRSSQLGVDIWQTAFVSNIVGAIVYSGLWLVGGPPIDAELWWQPLLVAVCLFSAMAMQFFALNQGDVSIAVPVMSTKILMVAMLAPLLVNETLQPRLWISAVLSVLGVTLLNSTKREHGSRSVATAVSAGLATAACFAIFDILIQKFGLIWGVGRLLPCVFWINGLLSLVCWWGFRAPLTTISPTGWKWLLTGSVLVNLQGIIFISCLAMYGGVTGANIIYSARGLISVVLIWVIGHRFSSPEATLSRGLLLCRLVGAALMLIAIMLALWTS